MREKSNVRATEVVTSLYESWYAPMVRFASRSLGNTELAEEAVQEAFMELYKQLREGGNVEEPKAWVMRVIRRKVWREFASHPDDQLHHESLEVVDLLPRAGRMDPLPGNGELAGLLSVLSHREEEALLLRAAGLGYREIAVEMKLTTGAVGTLLSRALRKMQAVAQGDEGRRQTARHVEGSDSKTLQ